MSGQSAPASYRWWLNLQVGLGAVGGLAWLLGAWIDHDFLAGLGCGLLIAAVLLRFGRDAARREGEA